MRLRHLRDGIERRVPFEDKFYNPNFQTMRGLDIQLMPVRKNLIFKIESQKSVKYSWNLKTYETFSLIFPDRNISKLKNYGGWN